METQKNSENNTVLEMKRLLGRMMVQVDYMYRNDREVSRLDLDIMMERTREFYELLCDYQSDKFVGANHHSPDDETLSDYESPSEDIEINEGGELIHHDVEMEIETPTDDETLPYDKTLSDDEVSDETEISEETEIAENEEIPENVETPENVEVAEETEEEDEEDWEDEDDEVFHVEPVAEEPEKPVAPEPEDNSLAARLQRTHVSDIRMAMGINDKVMIINDLFRGSVERYNKSIDALNEFPTLSGARVYMNELQIELQWDTESQAYKMLNDLVERRFV